MSLSIQEKYSELKEELNGKDPFVKYALLREELDNKDPLVRYAQIREELDSIKEENARKFEEITFKYSFSDARLLYLSLFVAFYYFIFTHLRPLIQVLI